MGALRGLEIPPRGDDWPPTGEGEDEWEEDVGKYMYAVDRFMEEVEAFDVGRLHEGVPREHYPYSYLEMLLRVTFHNLHHGGQLAILRPVE